jgi:hypothetical protein
VLGNIPYLTQDPAQCLSRNPSNIQVCSASARSAVLSIDNTAEMATARATGTSYVNVTPWFCSQVCTTVIGSTEAFMDRAHVTTQYTLVLVRVLRNALAL